MKVKFRTILVCAALTAAVSLSIDSYFCSGKKCLRKSVCRGMPTVSKSNSCCKVKLQASRPQAGKCGSPKRCCFKKPEPTATVDNQQFIFLSNQVQPVFLAGATLPSFDFISYPASFSTGPPAQFGGRMQAVFCVFII
jgi:hypothetical protein